MFARLRFRVLGLAAVPLACVALVGCGGSKPGYCSDRANLESSIKGLTDLKLSNGVSGLEAQLNKIKSDATALVNAVKSEYSNETKAIKSSVEALTNTVKSLPSPPSAGDVANVATQASAVVTSVKAFTDASSVKCK